MSISILTVTVTFQVLVLRTCQKNTTEVVIFFVNCCFMFVWVGETQRLRSWGFWKKNNQMTSCWVSGEMQNMKLSQTILNTQSFMVSEFIFRIFDDTSQLRFSLSASSQTFLFVLVIFFNFTSLIKCRSTLSLGIHGWTDRSANEGERERYKIVHGA